MDKKLEKIKKRTDKAATDDWSALPDRGDKYVGQLIADVYTLIRYVEELESQLGNGK